MFSYGSDGGGVQYFFAKKLFEHTNCDFMKSLLRGAEPAVGTVAN